MSVAVDPPRSSSWLLVDTKPRGPQYESVAETMTEAAHFRLVEVYMNHRLTTAAFVAGLLILAPAALAVPAFVTYSGRLTDGTAWGQTTTATLIVSMYSCECESAAVCTHVCEVGEDEPFYKGQFPNVPIMDGYFSVQLGMCDAAGLCTADPEEAFFPDDLPGLAWLGIAVNDAPELYPRQPIGSVPYAVLSRSATECLHNNKAAYLDGV